ncbi:MAG TPA: alpha/beta hydrolase [Acidimicrobiales bacterium]
MPLPGSLAVPVHANAPQWFRRALDVAFHDGEVMVDGAVIHYLAWGEPDRRGLVFVHGGGAHAHWWTHVAARFATEFRVVAVDLSGHGDSGHRGTYAFEQWTDEVLAVADVGGIDGPPVVIGHSMGGFVTIATAALHGDRLEGVVVCDSPVTEPDPEVESYRLKEAFGNPRTYTSVDEAMLRFRTVPPQAHYLDYVIDHVARRSLRPVEGGWQWKFDRRIFEQFSQMRGVALPYLPKVRCRFALLRSEQGLVTPDIGASMYDALGRVAPVIELPEAGHHAMLDQPLELLTALRTLLADWEHSDPHRVGRR